MISNNKIEDMYVGLLMLYIVMIFEHVYVFDFYPTFL